MIKDCEVIFTLFDHHCCDYTHVLHLTREKITVIGQTIYVPIYSYIYHYDRKETYNLTATLSIRNTDLTSPIVVTSVRYNNSAGLLVRKYLERPIQVAALASTHFVVDSSDTSGGLGANFIVEWVAQTEVSSPIVEAIMVGSSFQQGISWISPGKAIESKNNRSSETSLSGS